MAVYMYVRVCAGTRTCTCIIATGSWPSNTKGEEAYSALYNVTSFYPSLYRDSHMVPCAQTRLFHRKRGLVTFEQFS